MQQKENKPQGNGKNNKPGNNRNRRRKPEKRSRRRKNNFQGRKCKSKKCKNNRKNPNRRRNDSPKKRKNPNRQRGNCQCSRNSTEGITFDCLTMAWKYTAFAAGYVKNLKGQSNRMGKQNSTGKGKSEKKGAFEGLIVKLLDAGGGNKSDLTCSGAKGPGADQLQNLTDLLTACKENIFNACDPTKIPQPNKTKLEGCLKTGDDFSAKIKECKGKSESDACACWTDPSLKTMQDEMKMNCNFTGEAAAIKTQFKACKSAFGSCRKYEDDVLTSVVSCSKSPEAQKQAAAALSKNVDAVKDAQAKIASLTARRLRRSWEWREASCTVVIEKVKVLTKLIGENPKSPKVAKVAVEISSVTVTCSDEEKNALKEEQASLSSAEES